MAAVELTIEGAFGFPAEAEGDGVDALGLAFEVTGDGVDKEEDFGAAEAKPVVAAEGEA